MNPFPVSGYRTRIVVSVVALLAVRCGNDPAKVAAVSGLTSGPLVSAKNIEVTFSDSGRIVAKLYAPLLNRFTGSNACTDFPEGFRIEIYDTTLRVETTITGDRGKRFDEKRFMEARGNVVVRNELRNRQLNTEHLTWDEARHRITSDTSVKIITSDKILFGNGLEANESFSWYRITNPSGQMMVNNDSI